MNSSYLIFMLGSAMITAGVHYLLAGGMKKRGLLAALTFVFGAVLGVICAKLMYGLICIQDVLLDGIEETLLSDSMECLSFFGGAAGVILGAALAAKCTGNKVMKALDAYAPAGALMAALARFAEYFLGTVCVGRMIEEEALQFFPLALGVDYGYGYTEWYLAVFMLAGIAALIVFLVSLNRFKEKRFIRTLFYLCLPQIILKACGTTTALPGRSSCGWSNWPVCSTSKRCWCCTACGPERARRTASCPPLSASSAPGCSWAWSSPWTRPTCPTSSLMP